MTNSPRAVAYIDLRALENNYRSIRQRLGAGVRLLGVVKADAYGHGAREISEKLRALGIDYLGVATVDEGMDLRKNGIAGPLLIMSGIFSWDELEPVLRYDLTPVIYDEEVLKRVVSGVSGLGRPLKVHIKFDTGMGRLGLDPSRARGIAGFLKGASAVELEGLMSHFSASEVKDEYGDEQVRKFMEVIGAFKDAGMEPPCIHMGNSGAVVNYPEAHFTMVRTGISLYGSHPSPGIEEELPLRQVMKVVARIALVREFPPGVALSYGRTYVTDKQARIAYIPVGYSDGYPRSLSNKGLVLIKDRKCSIVGRVCMDWILADVTDLSGVKSGDEAILLGEGEGSRISANDMAQRAGMIPYEILCRISRRIVRVYV